MSLTVTVDRIASTGHGLCAELLPELISLDEWGYPILDPHPVPGPLVGHAKRAVAACPVLALHLARPAGVDRTATRRNHGEYPLGGR
jgi:ferredoxin